MNSKAQYYKDVKKWVIINTIDKKPINKNWTAFNLNTNIEIKDNKNIAVITGDVSGIIVLDIDNKVPQQINKIKRSKNKGIQDWKDILNIYNNNEDIKTLKATTPSGGLHYYFKYNDKVKHLYNRACTILNNKNEECAIDIKTNKGCVLIEPSIKKIDNRNIKYSFINIDTEIIEMPEWLINEINKIQIKDIKNDDKYNNDNNNEAIETLKEELKQNNITIETERQLTDLLDIIGDHYNDYNGWMIVANVLKNINTSLFNIFNEWSKKSIDKYKGENDCKRIWNIVGNYKFTIGTLIYWAKQENKELYEQWKMKYKPVNIELTFNGLEGYIAQYIKAKYLKLNCICTNITNKTFYYFNGTRWVEDINYCRLYNYIKYNYSNEIKNIYFSLIEEFNKKSNEDEEYCNSKEAKLLKGKIESLNKIDKKINGKPTFIEDVIKIIARDTFDKDFYNKLNEYRHLIGFDDGVYDLKNNTFRQGRYDDYISYSVGYNYNNKSDINNIELNTFLNQVFPNKDVREYVLQQIAQMLCGNNYGEIVHTHTGIGKNGKSKFCKLLEYTFGDYWHEVPVTMITKNNKLSYNKPDPTLSNLKGVRCMVASEPNEGEEINDALIKKIGSQEELEFRMLYSNLTQILKFQCKCHIFCNDKLKVNGDDEAIGRRMRVIPYVSVFTENNIDEENNIYKVNYNLDEVLNKCKESFMALLLSKFKYDYIYTMPDIIKEKSEKYMSENNLMKDFIESIMIKTNNKNDFIKVQDAWSKYSCNDNYDKMKQSDFRRKFIKNLKGDHYERKMIDGENYKNIIIGWTFKEDENND